MWPKLGLMSRDVLTSVSKKMGSSLLLTLSPQITRITRINGRKKAQNTQNKNTYKVKVVGGEVSADFFDRGLCLPSGTAMTNGDLDRIIGIILRCHRK